MTPIFHDTILKSEFKSCHLILIGKVQIRAKSVLFYILTYIAKDAVRDSLTTQTLQWSLSLL